MRFFFIITLLIAAFSLRAQEVPGLKDQLVDTSSLGVHHYRAGGLAFKAIRDEALSPLLFQGPGISFSRASWKYRNKWLWQSVLGTQLYLLQNQAGSSLLFDGGLNYQFTALRELSSLQKGSWRFWAGPQANVLLNYRMHSRNSNNLGSYEGVLGIGGSAMISNEFTLWGRRFAVSNQLHLPLAFLYARPAYSWSIPPAIYEGQEGAWKEALQLGTLNDILLLENQLNLDFLVPKRRNGKLIQHSAYRISYSWRYFQVSTKNKMQSGVHLLAFSRIITF